MYMSGMNELPSWDSGVVDPNYGTGYDTPQDWETVFGADYATVNVPQDNGLDWGGIFKTAVSTWGQVQIAKTAADANVRNSNPFGSSYPYGYPMNTGINPVTGIRYPVTISQPQGNGFFGMSTSTMLIIGLLIGGAIYVARQ